MQCQNERSQSSNKQTAMKLLRSKLVELEERRRREELAREKGEAEDVAWGSQIRSYVLHPYTMVKDHRTGYEVGDAQRVLDGDLDGVRARVSRAGGSGLDDRRARLAVSASVRHSPRADAARWRVLALPAARARSLSLDRLAD